MSKEDTQFKPGQSGNPDGRPKGSGLCLTSLLKEHLEKIPDGKKEPYKVMFIKTLLHKALVKKDLQALKLVINYVDGLPKQVIEGDINLYKLNIVRPDKDKPAE